METFKILETAETEGNNSKEISKIGRKIITSGVLYEIFLIYILFLLKVEGAICIGLVLIIPVLIVQATLSYIHDERELLLFIGGTAVVGGMNESRGEMIKRTKKENRRMKELMDSTFMLGITLIIIGPVLGRLLYESVGISAELYLSIVLIASLALTAVLVKAPILYASDDDSIIINQSLC